MEFMVSSQKHMTKGFVALRHENRGGASTHAFPGGARERSGMTSIRVIRVIRGQERVFMVK